jgi:hypothetical protein
MKHTRQPPSNIDYFAQQLNNARTPTWANNIFEYDVELNVCTSFISGHHNWKITAKPMLTP